MSIDQVLRARSDGSVTTEDFGYFCDEGAFKVLEFENRSLAPRVAARTVPYEQVPPAAVVALAALKDSALLAGGPSTAALLERAAQAMWRCTREEIAGAVEKTGADAAWEIYYVAFVRALEVRSAGITQS